MNLDGLVVNEISQSFTNLLYETTYRKCLRAVTFIEIGNRMMVARGWGEGESHRFSGHRISVLQEEESGGRGR
jgi:hypothetical protein